MIILFTIAFCVSAAFGTVSLLLTWFAWGLVSRFYADFWPKLVIAVARCAAATAAVAVRLQGSEEWNWLAASAIGSWLLWEITQVLAEWKSKKTAKRAAELDREVRIRTRLLTGLRSLTNKKADRVRAKLADHPGPAALIRRAREALDPAVQIHFVLEALAILLSALHRDPASAEADRQQFRIGLYVVGTDGFLWPWAAFDRKNGTRDPFTSWQEVKDRFRLDNCDDPAHAVRCVQEKRTIIVSDCVADAAAGLFTFFRKDQKNYLKSLVAYPVDGNIRSPKGTMEAAALVIDTDVPGFFTDADRARLEIILDEFAARLKLEAYLFGL